MAVTAEASWRGPRAARASAPARRGQPVVDPGAAALAVGSPLAQDPQVMADRRLAEVERGGQLADARLAALVRADQGHQPEPDRSPRALNTRASPAAAPSLIGSPTSGVEQASTTTCNSPPERASA